MGYNHHTMTAKERYREFLKTPFWKDLSRRKLEQVGHCEVCGYHHHLQAHHLFYRLDWFDTKLEDLQVLCRTCHRIEHGRLVMFPFDIVAHAVETHLNRMDRGSTPPSMDNFRVMALLALDRDDVRKIEDLIRRRSGMRIGCHSEKLWASWLSKPREVKDRWWRWAEHLTKQLAQEAGYVG